MFADSENTHRLDTEGLKTEYEKVELTAYDVNLMLRAGRRCTICGDIWSMQNTKPRMCHYCYAKSKESK